MALANKIRQLRNAAGKSLQQVADEIGVSKAHISDLETGISTNPTFDVLRKLAAVFEVTVVELIEEASPTLVVSSNQIELWIKQIRRAQASGMDLDDAAAEARELFEQQVGLALDATQEAAWIQAREEIQRTLRQEIEYLGNYSLRKDRRPEWYAGPKASHINWPRLDAYMREHLKWDTATVSSIDRTSTEIVSLLENPIQSTFSGRGLVVGYVQSGKTANMAAVICKAVDVGYRLVIILTGMTNSLRRQTQRRIERDVCKRNPYDWIRHTSDDADFRSPPNVWFAVTDQIQLAILKKNVNPLAELLNTIKETPATLRERLPVLLIDDECDQASVNASGSQFNTTAINGLIREILHELPRVQYVGYTATPFANILINPETPSGQRDDLYPRDFITALPLPNGYFGPESLFGRKPINADDETPEDAGLNMIRAVAPPEVAVVRPPSKKAKDTFSPSIPESMDRALKYFVLATACRYARGQQKKHSSMLIHTTVYTKPHEKQAAIIAMWRDNLLDRLSIKDVLTELKEIWEEEQVKVPAERFGLQAKPFDEVALHIGHVLRDIEIVVENSDSESRLDFENGPKKYIVIGGSVLARGLTIEGLIVSYFVRTSNQYDTLLQMGRWFGYRPSYEDLPRIWMTPDLAAAFKDLATVEAEIRADLNEYRKRDITPLDFAVRIRRIPRLAITAAKKMIASESCDVSFSGEHLQTIRFNHLDETELKNNWMAAADLVNAATADAAVQPVSRGRLLKGIPLKTVISFLNSYRGSRQDLFTRDLIDYIEQEAKRAGDPFHKWNIAVIEPQGKDIPSSRSPLGALGTVKLVNRAKLDIPTKPDTADIKALMSKQDVLLDVELKEGESAGADWKDMKRIREDKLGDKTPLLLLYAIDAHSKAKPGSTTRMALDAAHDILGVGLVFPERGEKKSYVRVTLSKDDPEEAEDFLGEIAESGDKK